MSRVLMGHLRGRKQAQFVVNEREQLACGVRITRINGDQNLRYVGHEFECIDRAHVGEEHLVSFALIGYGFPGLTNRIRTAARAA